MTRFTLSFTLKDAPLKMMMPFVHFSLRSLPILLIVLILLPNGFAQQPPPNSFPVVQLPAGFRIEKVVDRLTYPTSIAWDEQGRMYVVEAGGQFLEEPPPPRILRIENGRAVEVVNLESKGVADSVGGMTYHQGSFLITHREPSDRSGAVSRVGMDGTVTRLITGIVDSQSEHQVNGIRVGPDGRVYFASGPAANSGVVGIDIAPFVQRSPMLHTTPCVDYILAGINFQTPDFRTTDPSDLALTEALFRSEPQPLPDREFKEITGAAEQSSHSI